VYNVKEVKDMEFVEDLIVNFVENLGFSPIEVECKKAENLRNKYIVWCNKNISFVFDGLGSCEMFLTSDKTQDSELHNDEWRSYILHHTKGLQRMALLNEFIETSKEEVIQAIDDYISAPEINTSQISLNEMIDSKLETHLALEEDYFSSKLNSADTKEAFDNIINRATTLRAEYCAIVHNKICEYLDSNVTISLNENCEQVYNFTEEQHERYEKLLEAKNDFEFTYNYQIYRADMRELEVLSNQSE